MLTALRQWGDKYLDRPRRSPVGHHAMKGAARAVHVKLICEEGHEVGPDDLRRDPGPAEQRPRQEISSTAR